MNNDRDLGRIDSFMETTARDIEEIKENIKELNQNVYKWQIDFEKRYAQDKLNAQEDINSLKAKILKINTIGLTVWGAVVIALKYFKIL